MADPSQGTEPLRIAGRAKINTLYSGAPDMISRQLNARGFGNSGKKGKALIMTDLARRGQMAGFEGNLAENILNRQDTTMDLANRLLAAGRGVSTSGNMLGGAVSAGSETLSTMLLLQKLLGSGVGGFNPASYEGVMG
jgi:hypothetical protein